jgi:hypothetical protein
MLYGVVIVVFGKVYPTEPNAEDTTHLLSEKRGFRCCTTYIACIDSVRTVIFVGRSSSKSMRRVHKKDFHHMIYGFDTSYTRHN